MIDLEHVKNTIAMYFSDTSRTQEETAEGLKKLKEYIEILRKFLVAELEAEVKRFSRETKTKPYP